MDRRRTRKGTYSKGVTEAPETEEEKRAYYKQRKLVPNFSSLFLVRNENHKPEQASRDAFDSLCEGVKSLEIFEDSLPGQKSNSLRKPLAVNNSLTNSLGGVSHHSANNTFDKLVFVGRSRVLQTSQVTACPSSSGSSLDCSELLFKSLLASVPTLDSNWARGTGLKSVPEAKECNVKGADVEQNGVAYLHDGVDQLSKTKSESLPYDKQGQISLQLFSSDDDSLDTADYRKETGQAQERQQSCKIGQLTEGKRVREGLHTRKGKNSTSKVDDGGVISLSPMSCKDTVEGTHSSSLAAEKDVREVAASHAECSCRVPLIKLTQITVQTDNSLLGQKFPGTVNIVSPSVQSKLESSSRDLSSPADLITDKKSPVGQKCLLRTSLKSIGSQHSGKSSVKSDICTSTPANTSRHKTALKSGSHWSLHASPSLENVLSPVPRDNSLITMDTSSVFESPMSFKGNSIVSSNKVGAGPSLGSKYESCLSSHNFEISHPVSIPLVPSRELVKDSSSCERENQSPESYDSSKEISNGPFKGVFIPLCDPKETSDNKLTPPHIFQKDHDANSMSVVTLPVNTRSDIGEISPVLVSFTRRRKKNGVKKLLKRLQSSRDISVGEKSVFVTQSDWKISLTPDLSLIIPRRIRQQKSKGDRYPLPCQYIPTSSADSDDEILKGSHENNQPIILTKFKAEESAVDEQSVILTRKSRLLYNSKKQLSISRQSPALLKRRTSERQLRRKCKSTFNDVASNQESSSCMSKLSTDNEESPVLTRRARLTDCNRNQFVTNRSPVLTRRASLRLLDRRTVLSDNVTDDRKELKVPPVQTRRSLRLLIKSSTIPPDGEDELQVCPARNKRSVSQPSKRSTAPLGDVTGDGEKSEVLSVHTRRPARQSARGCLTQCNVKIGVKGREELSMMDISKLSIRSIKTGLSCTGASAASDSIISESGFITTFRKRVKRKADKLVYYKANSSQDMFSSFAKSIEECSVIEEKELESLVFEDLKREGKLKFRSEVLEQESGDFKELDSKVGESSANEEESLKNQISVSEPNSISKELDLKKPNSSESTQESVNKNDNVLGKTVKFIQSIQNSNFPPELENGGEPLPFLSLVPVRRGKGWIRSLSMAVAQTSFTADGSFDVARRKTVHRISTGQRKSTNLRMSAIPPEINDRILQMGALPIEEVHSRSTLQISVDHDRQQDYQLPSDPGECVLQLCSQEKPLPLTECFTETRLACCKKIGEGVYGEVFMTRPSPNSMEGATVLKIMPIEGSFPVNGEPQKKFGEILSEIIISTELSSLQKPHRKENWTENFVHVLKSWCVQGRYHEDLLHLWDVFHEEKGSENDRPDVFPDSQLYIVLEFGHGGQDLESYVFNSSRDAVAVFLQIAYSLAVAEQELEFEHRDLHWGNVLVAQTQVASIDYKLSGGSYNLQTRGLKATVIDFTLSRLKAPNCVVYNNLAEDPSLFTAEGDYQFEIYRQMKKANKNEWEKFTPYTNVLWLHYILDKMTSECYFKNVKTKIHKTHHAQLSKMKHEMLGYESATDFVLRRELVL